MIEAEYVDRILPEHLAPNSLSLVLFGPGRGEAMLVRFPNGDLSIIDGCREPKNKKGRDDPMREFLQKLQATQEQPLKIPLVCLTHPHDDHYAGLAKLIDVYREQIDETASVQSPSKRFGDAMSEWLKKTRAGKEAMRDDLSPKGFERFLEKQRSLEKKILPFSHNQILLESERQCPEWWMRACGPSSNDLKRGSEEVRADLEKLEHGSKSEMITDPNRTSGALVVRWGESQMLLAGDLVCGEEPHSSWNNASTMAMMKQLNIIISICKLYLVYYMPAHPI